jgi:hypothetical protein
MLSEFQINQVWRDMLEAEARSLYFGDLASRYTRRKQIITGLSLFLSSGAAAAIVAKLPETVTVLLAGAVAVINAYAISINLDGSANTMGKLHSSWNSVAADYNRLWNHSYEDDAEDQFYRIIEGKKDISELATTSAPNDQKLMATWQLRVFAMYHLKDQHGHTSKA